MNIYFSVSIQTCDHFFNIQTALISINSKFLQYKKSIKIQNSSVLWPIAFKSMWSQFVKDTNVKILMPSSLVFSEEISFSLNTLDTVTSMLLSHAVLMNWTGFRFDWKTSDDDIWIWFQPIRLYTKMVQRSIKFTD